MLGLARIAVVALALTGKAAAAGRGNSVYFSGESRCPVLCDTSGPNPDNWTVYHSVERLDYCDKPLILSFGVFHALDDPSVAAPSIRTCALGSSGNGNTAASSSQQKTKARQIRGSSRNHGRQSSNSTKLDAGLEQPAQGAWKESSLRSDGADVVTLAGQLKIFLDSITTSVSSSLGPSLFFIRQRDTETSVGIYAASGVSTSLLIDTFADFIKSHGYAGDSLVQACEGSLGSKESAEANPAAIIAAIGMVASTGPQSLVAAQSAVRQWANLSCVPSDYGSFITLPTRLRTAAVTSASDSMVARSLNKRATCKTASVAAGNLCADLAKKCGITTDQLLKFNPQANFCTTLKVPQLVCCSAGELPIPKPDQNGNCATYKIASGDSCWAITNSLSNLISVDDLEKYNKNTWGWGTCNNLQPNTLICLSSGTPPLPLPVPNAACGPIKPGTAKPPAGTSLASLNPCPLNACCDVWGYCGTTDEFCRPIPAGQAPGAPQPIGGPNCVSNCGTGIVNNGVPPASFFSIGYFEGYGLSRACDKVDIRTIDLKKYTHIHFAFATVTADTFGVDMGPTINQFYYFKQLTGVKKILSFGGWTFSTDPATYGIFRTGVLGANRQKMAQNIANFVLSNNLDGVDIDWEYPAAPDIPGIPKADPVEGEDYLQFLTTLRSLLPKSKTVSFAAPASFWYLQGFPIAKILNVVDYVIYMTYDLHGQWDYGNAWSDPGCSGGNCLRSHVNMTETQNALSMITKAGAASNKVVIGVTSYGRSFKMTTPGCTGPMCTYTGPDSGATPGKCTGTAGYISNAEIRDILTNNPSAKTTYDSSSQSDILVYDSTQWVAYMSDNTKKARQDRYKQLNFLGTTDWAISLDNVGLTAPPPEVIIGPNESFPWPQDSVNPRLHYSCEPYKDMIMEAWFEAGELTKTTWKWSRWNKYQKVMDDYLGPRSGQVPLFEDQLWSNFERHYKAHYGGSGSQRGLYNYYYCDKDAVPGKGDYPGGTPCHYNSNKKSGLAAVTYRSPGSVWSEYHTLLCPFWLGTEKGAPSWYSLKDTAYEGDTYPAVRQTIDRWSNTVRAVTIFHETVHWQDISWPTCDNIDADEKPEVYRAEQIVSMARNGGNKGYEKNLRNAHSWTLAATAMWMMTRWPDISVPQPRRPIPATVDTFDEEPEEGWNDVLDIGYFDAARVNPDDYRPMSHYQSGPVGLTDCTEGQYEWEEQCLEACDLGDEGRKCSQNKDKTWQCKGCDKPPTSCTPGLYDGWDDCSSHCLDGMCWENAGEPRIECKC